jgi:hypothetical protein
MKDLKNERDILSSLRWLEHVIDKEAISGIYEKAYTLTNQEIENVFKNLENNFYLDMDMCEEDIALPNLRSKTSQNMRIDFYKTNTSLEFIEVLVKINPNLNKEVEKARDLVKELVKQESKKIKY